MSVAEKRKLITSRHDSLSIRRQCELLGLSRCSYYRHPVKAVESDENLALMRLIDKEYTDHPFYGTRKIRVILQRHGYVVNRKRVQRLMRKMGIRSVAPGPQTSKKHPEHKIYPYLLRKLDIVRPNQVWCSDITYIPLSGGFAYLTAVMDWYSRYTLSWEVSISLESAFCITALESALRRHGRPDIFNTDQGVQYTSNSFIKVLKDAGVRISMNGKKRVMDNIMIERLWRSVKYEKLYLEEYLSVQDVISGLRKYFEFYNHERPHNNLGDKRPCELFNGCEQAAA
jgi:putative transposase